jgi:hypothetical protein
MIEALFIGSVVLALIATVFAVSFRSRWRNSQARIRAARAEIDGGARRIRDG